MAVQTVYKYPFRVSDLVTIDMPAGARILHIDIQRGQPCLWALVDPEDNIAPRCFRVFGTGHRINRDWGGGKLEFVATFQQPPFVWHVFEVATP